MSIHPHPLAAALRALALASAALLVLPVLSSPANARPPRAPAAPDPALQARADHDFRSGRLAAAFGGFRRLADSGDARAARIALLMAEEGAPLFGRDWYASPDQQRRWTRATGASRPAAPAWTAETRAADRRPLAADDRPLPPLPQGDVGE